MTAGIFDKTQNAKRCFLQGIAERQVGVETRHRLNFMAEIWEFIYAEFT
jgi:hypothetical protein